MRFSLGGPDRPDPVGIMHTQTAVQPLKRQHQTPSVRQFAYRYATTAANRAALNNNDIIPLSEMVVITQRSVTVNRFAEKSPAGMNDTCHDRAVGRLINRTTSRVATVEIIDVFCAKVC